MAAVVGYWALPEEEKNFLVYLERIGTILAVPSKWVEAKSDAVPRPIASFIEEFDPTRLWFGLAEDLTESSIQQKQVDGKVVYGLPYMKPNVVGYDRGKFHDGKLGRCNLCAYWTFPNDDASALIRKDERFIKWAKRVLNWARRATPEQIQLHGFPYRATRLAKAAYLEGKIDVML